MKVIITYLFITFLYPAELTSLLLSRLTLSCEEEVCTLHKLRTYWDFTIHRQSAHCHLDSFPFFTTLFLQNLGPFASLVYPLVGEGLCEYMGFFNLASTVYDLFPGSDFKWGGFDKWNVDNRISLFGKLFYGAQEIGSVPRGPPPASKEEVAKLPIVEVTQAYLEKTGEGAECAVCQEPMVVGDKLQEMPCKHNFHPDCLKPWLV